MVSEITRDIKQLDQGLSRKFIFKNILFKHFQKIEKYFYISLKPKVIIVENLRQIGIISQIGDNFLTFGKGRFDCVFYL